MSWCRSQYLRGCIHRYLDTRGRRDEWASHFASDSHVTSMHGMSVCVPMCEAGRLGERDLCMVSSGWRCPLPLSNTEAKQSHVVMGVGT